ncbi:hypothetical protein HMPREF0185_00149 [Brevundimonas diminuta 470-4]|nr:hypothetical protein HMPREF0185_00149 [Brevundimonas diminuta 470-4]
MDRPFLLPSSSDLIRGSGCPLARLQRPDARSGPRSSDQVRG